MNYFFRPDTDFQKDGCLLIDRHICNKPGFIQDKCDRKKNFVCMGMLNEFYICIYIIFKY